MTGYITDFSGFSPSTPYGKDPDSLAEDGFLNERLRRRRIDTGEDVFFRRRFSTTNPDRPS